MLALMFKSTGQNPYIWFGSNLAATSQTLDVNGPLMSLLIPSNCTVVPLSYLSRTEPPSSPEKLRVLHTDRGRVTLAWNPPRYDGGAPTTGYIIEMAPGSSTDFVEIATIDGNTCKYEATELRDGQIYNFRIKAQNCAGISRDGAKLNEPVTASPSYGKTTVTTLITNNIMC